MKYIREEYPRPQFKRDSWTQLNGQWDFTFDDADEGIKKGWYKGTSQFSLSINVPFSYQYEASGIGDTTYHEIVWYKRTFENQSDGKNALICFNACDYECDVWVNGIHVKRHIGGFSPFSAEITHCLKRGTNTVVVRCRDSLSPTQPRGKQSWLNHPFGCWYTPNTGIWQSVWIEYFSKDCIESYSLIPDIDTSSFAGEIKTLNALADSATIDVYFADKLIKTMSFSLDGKYTRYHVSLMETDFVDESMYWTPENPRLLYVDFSLKHGGKLLDTAHTRFGMRKISVDASGVICLNNIPVYQRLILDQGYWKESGLTPPSADSIKQDIMLSKQMGFNGARKHQKFEDPYFYYYAEELGFLTWCEMPSAYNFNADEVKAITAEWQEILGVARNFTSVICYVPLNESWGTRKILVSSEQQNFGKSLYYLTKCVDNSRLVSVNDGWENIDESDLISIHDYAKDGGRFDRYRKDNYDAVYPTCRKLMANGNHYGNHPVLLTEFGGIAMSADSVEGNWGYNSGANDAEEFYERYKNLMDAIYATEDFQGFCYTQLTDVMQEVNGLLTPQRKCKFDTDRIRKITEGK